MPLRDAYTADQLAERCAKAEIEIERLREALSDLLNDCINFDGGKLTDSIMKKASAALLD